MNIFSFDNNANTATMTPYQTDGMEYMIGQRKDGMVIAVRCHDNPRFYFEARTTEEAIAIVKRAVVFYRQSETYIQ